MKTIIRILLFSLAVLVMTNVSAQKQRIKRDSTNITSQGEPFYGPVDKNAEFPGGMDALMKYISNSIKYPEPSFCGCIQGRVIVQFTVAKDGTIQQVKVIRGVVPALDKEAIRIVKAMPKWKPAVLNGKPVPQRFVVPVLFRLI